MTTVVLKRDIPVLRYSNIDELRIFILRNAYHLKDRVYDLKFYPCWQCNGHMQVRDIKDLCYIEGYKDAPWYPCGKCNGTGTLHPDEYVPVIKEELERYTTANREYEIMEKWLQDLSYNLEIDDFQFILTNVKIEHMQ